MEQNEDCKCKYITITDIWDEKKKDEKKNLILKKIKKWKKF